MTEKKRKILLIDDDTSLLTTLRDFLSFEGYDVTTADCGEQGLKKLENLEPELIILDMSMPGMGGVGFLKEISDASGEPGYPVLVLTARANMAEFFANVDVDGFIAKPCDPADLLMEVGRIIFLRSGAEGQGGTQNAAAKRKILLGEDDAARNRSLADAFTAAGYIVASVAKGPDVLEKAIVERPDVVVIKLMLENMNGDAVAEMMKEMPNTKRIPVVLYDDSGLDVPESKYVHTGTNIKRFVQSHAPEKLLQAVGQVLA